MKEILGGVVAANGFYACGVRAGVKKEGLDLALIYSVSDCVSAAQFTKNVVKAAPVLYDMSILKKKKPTRAIICNSGNANACTGLVGQEDALMMCNAVSDELGIDIDSVYVSSTGVIGVPLPIEKIQKAVVGIKEKLGSNHESGVNAANAIMTTDTCMKEVAIEIMLDNKLVHIGGIAKGSGMIHPNMGTMLSFITTDCSIDQDLLQEALGDTVGDTYNMISVDGDTSTNDTVIVMANGLCDNEKIVTKDTNYFMFKEALKYVNERLAKKIVADGEGALKVFEVNVVNYKNVLDAKKIAKAVVTSSLVKTAIFGSDANWGRILCAMGYSGVDFDPNKVKLSISSSIGDIKLFEKGTPIDFDEDNALKILSENYLYINIDMNEGKDKATAWGCDLSYEYVKINGEYRS